MKILPPKSPWERIWAKRLDEEESIKERQQAELKKELQIEEEKSRKTPYYG